MHKNMLGYMHSHYDSLSLSCAASLLLTLALRLDLGVGLHLDWTRQGGRCAGKVIG